MMRIALTNLGKYNEGTLAYQWLDLPATEEEIEETLEKIGIDGEEYEEYFISDYETDIRGLTIGEHEDLDELNELAKQLDNLEEYESDILAAILEATSYDIKDALKCLDGGDFQFYPGMDLTEVAENMVDEGLFGDTKDIGTLVDYIDYERLGRDLGYDGYTETSRGVIMLN